MALLRWRFLRGTVHAGMLLKGKAQSALTAVDAVLLGAPPLPVVCLDGSRAGLVFESRHGFAGIALLRDTVHAGQLLKGKALSVHWTWTFS